MGVEQALNVSHGICIVHQPCLMTAGGGEVNRHTAPKRAVICLFSPCDVISKDFARGQFIFNK